MPNSNHPLMQHLNLHWPTRQETYWGWIETTCEGPVAFKRIFMRKGSQSSMEFHCNKHEIYYVLRGRLKVGLRVGRGLNTSLTVREGQSFYIPPGKMHMRIALEDTEIMEACAFDSPEDTHIVFDGKTYAFTEGEEG